MINPPPAPERTMSLTTTRYGNTKYVLFRLEILIDGVSQPAQWGTGTWNVPSDRAVKIEVMLIRSNGRRLGYASYSLEPGAPTDLEYRPPTFFTQPGDLGPIGTVVFHGGTQYLIVIAIAVGALVVLVPIAILLALVL